MSAEFITPHVVENEQKIVMLIMDGLGGLPNAAGKTELEAAKTPNMDRLAKEGALGLADPVGPGVAPGSGPSHFALWGYDPIKNDIGRGALAATGIGFELRGGDVAARINFCTVDADGNVTDRRAGRIATELNAGLCKKLDAIRFQGVELFVRPVKDHRAVVVFRGPNLTEHVCDTDPQQTGVPPLDAKATNPKGSRTAELARHFIREARGILKTEHPANMILMRGFAECPSLPSFRDAYKLKAAAIAVYPDYKGMARICGMDVQELGENATEADEIKRLEEIWKDHTFFYIHIKKTDSYGEDGNYDGKLHVIETVDALVPRIRALEPAFIVITGDHSTPSQYAAHSFHPVPVLVWGKWVRPDDQTAFGETACGRGALGRFPSTELMMLALGHTQKVAKYGA
ncbi:MAG: 2,3-bisphosphoglycerate-independent phosphoglycerate mutase [Kiritimatiellae bacterium]|nr:2,3-bisphosphoglycerate-independent phosphoglycerate mutase [Kiritimatiellia bacterium]